MPGPVELVEFSTLARESGMSVAAVYAVFRGLGKGSASMVTGQKVCVRPDSAVDLEGAAKFRRWVAEFRDQWYEYDGPMTDEQMLGSQVVALLQTGSKTIREVDSFLTVKGAGREMVTRIKRLLGLPRIALEGIYPPKWTVEAPKPADASGGV